MRLKSVRIFGFKTFADKTEFSLDGGIVAVVGPNGCGKSNLVDAILWALGESNARHLRAAAGQDVIFSGSSRRKPVGFAEVSLLFDNEDGALPIDTAEVSITRRLNRAGESDYYINRRSCRQRDIHDLFADSGLGRAGYAIVSQKEIDQALAASPEDRRAWVDEAAGVQRYRSRKVESIKRLASAKEHLTRVDDIVYELDAQREPLRQEAEIAQKYKSAASALREVETGLLIQEFAKATREVDELEVRLGSSADLARKETARAEELDANARFLRDAIALSEQRIEEIRGRLQDAMTNSERGAAGIGLAEERLRSLDDLEQTLATQSGESEQLIAEADHEVELFQRDAMAAQEALEAMRLQVGGVGEEAQALAAKVQQAERELAQGRESHAARLRLEAEQELRCKRHAELGRELIGIERDLPTLIDAGDAAQAELDTLLARAEESKNAVSVADATLHELEQSEHASAHSARQLLAETASLEGRRRGIEATIQANEGLAQGSRAVLEAVERGELTGSYVPVGKAIRAKKELALAIETALGAAANDLIVEHDSDAKRAIEYLKQRRLGRATFQPIPLMRPSEVSPEMRRLVGTPGVVGRASELCDCDPAHRSVIDSLLGRVLVVEDIDVSLKLAKTGGWSRMVTLEGEVIHSSGAVTGGHTAKQQYGLVQRSSDLAQIEKELDKLAKEIARSEKDSEKSAASRVVLGDQIQQARQAVEAEQILVHEARQFLGTLQNELQAAERMRDKLSAEQALLASEVAMPEAVDLDRLQSERDRLMQELAGRSADAARAKERLEEAERRLQEAAARLAAAEKRLDGIRHSEESRAQRLKNLGPERIRLQQEIEQHKARLGQADDATKKAQNELHAAQSHRDTKLEESIRTSDEAKTVRENVAAIAAANHQAELGRARADSRRATSEERLLEEYGIPGDEALAQADTVEVPPDAAPLVSRLRREIKAMGMVNVGAIEAFDRLTSRHDELTAQREDILEGIEQVEASMSELDKLTREQFLDTFTEVEKAYSEIFQKLFGGGEGRVFLDTPSSILESGIEIEVTLPGKKRQRLELLSGGERALCATAFLFALLQTKPSPLVVLDEVDAPLDGRNVERFADLLQEFTDRVQFIVITHNPTTIERAPVWLGVTMQEPGVSTLVPARLPVAS